MSKEFTGDEKNKDFVQLSRDFMMNVAKLGEQSRAALSVIKY